MRISPLLVASSLLTTISFAAPLPPVPTEPIAKKKDLLFSDDFEGKEPNKLWHKVVPTFAFADGASEGHADKG